MHQIHQVAAVIDDDVRSHFENSSDMGFVFLRSGIIPREYIQSRLDKSSSHIILGRKRIAACHIHLGSTRRKNFTQVCCLGLKMHRESHFHSLERESLTELLFESVQKWHMMSDPIDFQPAILPELRISYFACHNYSFFW